VIIADDWIRIISLKRTLVAFLMCSFLGLMACQRPLSPETSCQFLQNPDLQRVSWKTNQPIPLYVHTSVPLNAHASLEAAIRVFEKNLGRKVFEIKDYAHSDSGPSRDGYSVIYWMDQWEQERLKEQGRTTVYWSGSTIYDADLRINASQESGYTFHMSSQTPVHGVDLTSLFVHELGHVLGLDHNHLAGSIMSTHLQEGVNRIELSQNDLSNLACEYN
jgi:hypothetical protein